MLQFKVTIILKFSKRDSFRIEEHSQSLFASVCLQIIDIILNKENLRIRSISLKGWRTVKRDGSRQEQSQGRAIACGKHGSSPCVIRKGLPVNVRKEGQPLTSVDELP